MRCTQGGVRRTRSQIVIVAALVGTVCFTLTGFSHAVAADDGGDDGFVIASDAGADTDDIDRDTHQTWRESAQEARRVDFVDVEQIPVPPPPSGEGYDMSPAPDHTLKPINPPAHGGPASGGCASGQCAVGGYADGGCADGGCADGGCDSCAADFDGYGCASCGACGPCPCGPPGRFWVRGEYLLWWTKGMDTPPLVTTSPLGTDRADAGVLGEPDTHVLFGGNSLFKEERSGGRIRFGMWLDCCNTCGIEGEYFGLEDANERFLGSSQGGVPILARPFFNPLIGAEDAELVGFPDVIEGDVGVEAESSLNSAGVRWRCNLCCSERECAPPCHMPNCNLCYVPSGTIRLDFLLGYRFMRLDESILIFEDLNAFPIDTQFELFDSFDTETEFHGVELGFIYEYHRCRWSLELLAKIALGNNHQEVTIDGGTRITAGGISDTFQGGLLAQRTNIGHFERDKFGVIPEIGVTLGYRVNDCLKLTFGYSFIYWSKVVRPGEQIDPVVNPNLLPPEVVPFSGPLRPAFAFNDSDYWAQGLSWGLELRW
ncbi:MAG: BBP7 family outer membrane beta-barrel protein [Planctomycetota bacterium]|nr:BBP7 family outer membrane beta-barrel protein [Planctomycetota bacterium]